jgi:hypothetical protein
MSGVRRPVVIALGFAFLGPVSFAFARAVKEIDSGTPGRATKLFRNVAVWSVEGAIVLYLIVDGFIRHRLF